MGEDIGGSIEVYDPGLNQWRMQGTMQDARFSPFSPIIHHHHHCTNIAIVIVIITTSVGKRAGKGCIIHNFYHFTNIALVIIAKVATVIIIVSVLITMISSHLNADVDPGSAWE